MKDWNISFIIFKRVELLLDDDHSFFILLDWLLFIQVFFSYKEYEFLVVPVSFFVSDTWDHLDLLRFRFFKEPICYFIAQVEIFDLLEEILGIIGG